MTFPFSMDELNEFEMLLDELEEKMKKPGATDLIEVKYGVNNHRFYFFEIDKALDYFNEKKREGYQVAMRKVEE